MASSEERLAVLIAKCKSNSDADAKVDAINKLRVEFQAGVELVDIDGLIVGLNSCLRTSNQHLSTATLSAIVSFFPLLVRQRPPSPEAASSSSNTSSSSTETATLRHALNAFLPSGGIIERLGDAREKARDKAREAMLVIGSVVFGSCGPLSQGPLRGKDAKVPETPLQVYERCLREQGLISKSWRVREQSILTLVQLRRANTSFPLRPFISPLVDALEDGDGTVRECARQSVVEVFTAPGVTDTARTDLKKEMAKKGVRKTIVDSVLTKLLSGEGQNMQSSDSGGGKEEPLMSSGIPPRNPSGALSSSGQSATSGMSAGLARPASRSGDAASGEQEATPVYVASARDLENEFSKMLPVFEGKETEQNWLARERSIIRIRGMLKGDAHTRYPETFLAGLKNGVLDGTLKAVTSLRTTLSSNTCSLYNDLAVFLGSGLDPFAETLLTHLLKMAGYTKKIIATASQSVVESILIHTSCHPRQCIVLLSASTQEKTVQARTFAVGHLKTFLDHHGLRSKHSIESTGGADLLEKCVKKCLTDPNPGVREKARLSFWSFEAVWKDRGHAILEGLDATARKQLQNVSPVPLAELNIATPATTPSKKSSVAAAIAANRAKAKKIAAAPPTLRHQATSTSHAQASRATSPPTAAKRLTSPAVNVPLSPSPPGRSPSSPRPSPLRNSSSSPPSRHYRNRTQSSSPSPPSSPSTEPYRRRISSLSTTKSVNLASTTHVTHSLASPAHDVPFGNPISSDSWTPLRTILDSHQRKSSPAGALDLEDSLLSATASPLPTESSLDDDDDSVNLMTFSAPWEISHSLPTSATPAKPIPSASRIGLVSHSIVEDALRARAAQAESAAEQLLELVEPDDGTHPSPIPPSLLPNNGTTPKPALRALGVAPVTPLNQESVIMRQAALFQDSPAHNNGVTTSIFELIEERKHQTGWWLRRLNIIDQSNSFKYDNAQFNKDLEGFTTALETGVAGLRVLRELTLLCHRNTSTGTIFHPTSPALPSTGSSHEPIMPPSPSPGSILTAQSRPVAMLGDIWGAGDRLEKLFSALCTFLKPEKDREILEHGLFALWEMLPQLDGRDADVFALLLKLRYAQDFNVDEATLAIRDAQVELMNERNFTLYGLSTMDLCLKAFLAQPVPSHAFQDAKLRAHAFGLITMAKFIIRLPADILEEELPKIKLTLTTAYLNSEAIVRQAATTAITAAQVILQDETHLFALLEPLPDDKKNLLTYFFEKHNARGTVEQVEGRPCPSGMERLSSEMDRLDQRISTPPRRSH